MVRRMTDAEIKRLNEIVDDITPESVMNRMAGGYVPMVRPYPEELPSVNDTMEQIRQNIINNIKDIDWSNLPEKTQTMTYPVGESHYVSVNIELKDIPKGHKMR